MKIGFPNNPRKDILKEIKWIGRQGFDFVDLFLEEDSATPEKIDVAKVKKLLKKYNLDTVGHTAWYLPTGSPVKLLRDAAIREAERYFKVFNKLGVKYVTIHANWPPSMFSAEEGIMLQVGSLRKIVKIAGKYHLNPMLELLDTGKDSIENIASILDKVPSFYFHLDIGHANLFNKKVKRFIRRLHKKLKHIHMHDNHGTADEHLPLGKGNINFKKIIKELKKYGYDGTITLEIFSKNRNLAVKSMKKLRKLWNA